MNSGYISITFGDDRQEILNPLKLKTDLEAVFTLHSLPIPQIIFNSVIHHDRQQLITSYDPIHLIVEPTGETNTESQLEISPDESSDDSKN